MENTREVTVVDPTAEASGGQNDPGPDAGSLRGRTIGFRVDVLWRSWDWIVDEWASALEGSGAKVARWRRTQGLAGDAGQLQDEDFEKFLDSVDVAVVGLGNCGSCTSWTIKDAVAAASRGLPTVAVVTEQFENLARTLAGHYGRSGLRLEVLPYPLDVRPEIEVRVIAKDGLAGLAGRLGATL